MDETIIKKLINEIKVIVGGDGLNPGNIINVVINLMSFMEDYKGMSGKDKKQTVITSLETFIDESITEGSDLIDMKSMIISTIPILIDTIIKLDSGEIQIKVKKCISTIFPCC